MKTKEQIIREIAEHYNLNNRSVFFNEHGQQSNCCYKDENGNMCAFGRCIKPELIDSISEKYDTNLEVTGVSAQTLLNREGTDILKEEYQGHGTDFWLNMQSLHDNVVYWTETGLSETGKEKVESLVRLYKE